MIQQPKDYPDGPIQIVNPPAHGLLVKVLAGVASGVITLAIGFIGGATWSHNARITALEVHRLNDKEGQDKLERRVDSLSDRIKQ